MKNLPLKLKRILGTTIVLVLFFFLMTILKFSFVPETITPSEPLRLSSALIKNIEENPTDWKLTEIKIANETYEEILENKKCNIKLIWSYAQHTSVYQLVLPDTIAFDMTAGGMIYFAYDNIIRKREEHKLDSIYNFKEKIKIAKEQKILTKLCK